MGMSGVEANQECVSQFARVRARELAYVIFAIHFEGGQPKEIRPIAEGVQGSSPQGTWEEFVGQLPANEGRFAVFDLRKQTADGRQVEKVCFITWAPSAASVRNRMIVASSQDALKAKFDASGMPHIQANDADELDYAEVVSKVIRE